MSALLGAGRLGWELRVVFSEEARCKIRTESG